MNTNGNEKYKYVAVCGSTIVWIKEHPRKELLEWAGRKSAKRIFCGTSIVYHIGYLVAGMWFDVFGLEGNVFIKREIVNANSVYNY